jgi:hypothetical protein
VQLSVTLGKRLLAIATRWFDRTTVTNVFEPLVADWQREWIDAQGESRVRRLRVAIGGALGLALTALRCAARDVAEPSPSPAAAAIACATAGVAAVALTVVFLATMAAFGPSPRRMPLDLLLIVMVPQAVSVGLAPAMLPSLLMLRRSPRISWRRGGQVIAAGFSLALVMAAWIIPLSSSGYLFTASQNERMYQLSLQNDRDGRVEYPGTASRQLRPPSTPADRAARYERFRAQLAQRRASVQPPPVTVRSVFRSYQIAWLTVAFGLMGWALGGLGPATVGRAFGWWALSWALLIAPTALSRYLLVIWRLPYWLPTLLFGLAAIGLLLSAARRSTDQITSSPDQQIIR